MVADHSKSNAELMALASMPPPSAPPKPEVDLSGLSGVAFHRAYMAKMVTIMKQPSNSSRPRPATVRTTRSGSGPLRSCRRFAAISRRRARPEQGGQDNPVRMNPACAGSLASDGLLAGVPSQYSICARGDSMRRCLPPKTLRRTVADRWGAVERSIVCEQAGPPSSGGSAPLRSVADRRRRSAEPAGTIRARRRK